MKILPFFFFFTFIITANCQEKILFKGFGTEPFWDIEVTQSKVIFRDLDRITTEYTYNEIIHATGFQNDYYYQFNLKLEGKSSGKLVIKRFENCKCSDGMSENFYEYECLLIFNDYALSGCAVKE